MNSHIYFNGTDNTWRLESYHRVNEVPLAASLKLSRAQLPIGNHQWKLKGDFSFCGNGQPRHTFVLSVCGEDQFTCRNGECIPLAYYRNVFRA